jgi:alginate O-acetyltransferase complex protein AlgI
MYFVPVYILILFGTIVVDYIAGIMIEGAVGARRKAFLVMSIVANVGVLAVFKYFNFFAENVNFLFHVANVKANIHLLRMILPIGLSFHTFQAMSYTIEVYRGNQKAERHFGIYALYVMFYPQLVAGPIERPQNLLHQFHEKHNLEYENVAAGIRMMLWGMIKKVVIADRLALFCDPIFDNPHNYSGIALAMAAVFFVFELYCDFSGYSDIALGTARVMGYKLMVNFDRPLSSKSVTEFWRRWHISLSTWFSDYLFNPVVIAVRDWGKWAVVFGLSVTFLISGIWHGAGWKFATYGALHGIAMIYEFLTKKQRKKIFGKMPKWLNGALSKLFTFSFIALAIVFFRAVNMKESFYIIRKFFHVPAEIIQVIKTHKIGFLNLPGIYPIILPCLLLIIALESAHTLYMKFNLKETFSGRPLLLRWGLYYSALLVLIYLGVYEKHQFIYFQF